MSGSSYPSPISSTNSPSVLRSLTTTPAPALDDTLLHSLQPVSPIPRPSLTMNIPDHPAPRQSLEHASAALQAASNRIRQVRRSLLQLSDTLPATIPQTRPSERLFSPGHEAILLAGSQVDENVESRDQTLPQPISQRRENLAVVVPNRWPGLRSAQEGQSSRVSSRSVESSIDSHGSLLRRSFHPTLTSPASSRGPSYRPLSDPQILLQRDALREDPSTSLGRRVAMREGVESIDAVDIYSGLMQPDELPALSLATEQELHYLRTLGRLQSVSERRDTLYSGDSPVSASRSSQGTGFVESRRASQAQVHPHVPTSSNSYIIPWRTPEVRYWARYRPENRTGQTSLSDRSERLSVLSNFSVQNLSTPTSTSGSRPLLFDEPSSYLQQQNPPPHHIPEHTELPPEDASQRRNYVVRRRINVDGEELVYNINLDWADEDPSSWSNLGRDRVRSGTDEEDLRRLSQIPWRYSGERGSQTGQSSGMNTMLSNSESGTRRRGWARLDPDGNEISSDQEEEIERNRTQNRIRALHQAREILAQGNGSLSTFSQLALLGHSPPLPMQTSGPTPRLDRYIQPLVNFPSTPRPFRPDPLPMPLSEMSVSLRDLTKYGHEAFISVPRYACLAGR